MKSSETLFIIPGFKEKISDGQYVALRKMFFEKGFNVKMVPIIWHRKVMTDWVVQFVDFFQKNSGKKNAVFGFSFGAMIALITAEQLRPDRLVLCSLSPYFSEDLIKIPDWWKRFMGRRRIADLEKFSMRSAAKRVKAKAKVFVGGAERERFPQLAVRCDAAARALSTSVIVIDGVRHDIGDHRYRDALNREIL